MLSKSSLTVAPRPRISAINAFNVATSSSFEPAGSYVGSDKGGVLLEGRVSFEDGALLEDGVSLADGGLLVDGALLEDGVGVFWL